jgi:ParB family transcriptional regulator, chromosome partitioning protein
MGKSKGGLGRDFYSLLDDNSFESKGPVTKLALKDIQARRDQPRKDFDMNALQLLADSVREHGVIQPILVREIEFEPGKYEIVAGERRFRAAEMAGIDEIPVSVMTGDDLEVAKVALIENVQRKDLNPVEEAMAYRMLIDKFGLTQDQVASQAGKNRSTVANLLRLLDLPEEILDMLRDGSLSAGHARALLTVEDEEKQIAMAHRIEEKELSVREAEKLAASAKQATEQTAERAEDDESGAEADEQKKVYMKDLEERMMRTLGRRVKIRRTPRKRVVELSYEDDGDLEELLKKLAGQDIFE